MISFLGLLNRFLILLYIMVVFQFSSIYYMRNLIKKMLFLSYPNNKPEWFESSEIPKIKTNNLPKVIAVCK